jgi:predicted MFS family arabinose efflux permease
VTMGYSGLFWVDGVTCVAAALVFVYVLKAKDHKHVKSEATGPDIRSPYKDKSFLIFLLVMMLVAFVFLQLFSTMPLFYSDQFGLMEDEIGWLMGFNGLFIFVLEMPLIKKLEGDQYSKFRILIWSTVLIGLSFLVLNLTSWVGILWISMLLVTLGEMLNFPVGNTWAINRAEGGKKGEYMGLYTMCFAIAHIFGHNTGMQLIDAFGYDITWLIMGLLSLVAVFLLRWLERREQAAG